MDKKEFTTLIATLKASYNSKDFLATKEQIAVWFEMLKDLPYNVASYSVQKHIMTNKYPPTIAEIRQGTVSPSQFISSAEAWSLVAKAARNGIYNAQKEFDALPEAVQRAIGSPDMIRNMAMDNESAMTVQQSHFIRAYNSEVEKAKERALIPASVMGLIEQVDV